MKKVLFKSSFALIIFCFVGCTSYYHKKADIEYSNSQYIKAIEHYKKVVSNSDNHDAKIKLASSYRLTNRWKDAEPLYAEIVTYPESDPTNLFYYAKSLMHNADYTKAKSYFSKYLAKVPSDFSAEMLVASCDSLDVFMVDTTLYTIEILSFPEMASAFGSAPYKKGIVFAGEKEESVVAKQNPWTGKSYLDLYYSEKTSAGKWLSPKPLEGEINGSFHEASASFNRAGTEVYFTRSNYSKKKLINSSKNENNLQILKAKSVNGVWGELTEMPFNSKEYSVGHPFISNDEKTLYFISDMQGGYGGTDIYKATYDKDSNKWSAPENLGMVVNTSGNEMFPSMSNEGTFYFSSDAHTNMGGLDIFSTTFDEKTKRWKEVENLRYPINSTKDDFEFFLNPDTKTGSVSSNRSGRDFIYEFKRHDPTFRIKGLITQKGTKTAFDSVSIVITNLATSKQIIVLSDKNGNFDYTIEPNTDYSVYATRDNKFSEQINISTKNKSISQDFIVNMEVEKFIPPPVIVKEVAKEIIRQPEDFVATFDLSKVVIGKPIVLDNVYYDLGKWDIRPSTAVVLDKLVRLLKENPVISIEIGSHTDSRASDDFNLKLSDKRSKSVVDYLILKGVESKRLTFKGYGEKELINRCKNNVKCSDDEHQMNRRTEVKVTKIDRLN